VRQPPLPGGSAQADRNKMIAALLAIILGTIGAHKFYLGRIGWGVIYLLFCWSFVPTVLGIIEGVVYLGMTDQDFQAKYGQT
jgi:TM2 domain-containing membrane protein YozV